MFISSFVVLTITHFVVRLQFPFQCFLAAKQPKSRRDNKKKNKKKKERTAGELLCVR